MNVISNKNKTETDSDINQQAIQDFFPLKGTPKYPNPTKIKSRPGMPHRYFSVVFRIITKRDRVRYHH